MNRIPLTVITAGLVITFMFAIATNAAAEDDAVLLGDWPENPPQISLSLSGETPERALHTAAKQAGWGLVLNVPEEHLKDPLTLMLVGKPATEVFSIILQSRGLVAEFKDEIVFVRLRETPAASKRDRGEDEDDDDDAAEVTLKIGPNGLDINIDEEKSKRRDRRRKKRSGRHRERVEIGESVRVEAGEKVSEAVAVGGSVEVLGHVEHDVVAVGGSVTLRPGSEVGGDAVAVGGTVEVEPGATLHGDRVGVGVPLPFLGGAAGLSSILSIFDFFVQISGMIILFVISLLIFWVAPKRIRRVRDYIAAQPGFTTLGALVLPIGTTLLFLIMLATIILIPLTPLVVLAAVVMSLFGMSALFLLIGEKIPFFRATKTPIGSMLLGFVVVFVLSLIPILGWIILLIAGPFAASATLLSKFGSEPKSSIAP